MIALDATPLPTPLSLGVSHDATQQVVTWADTWQAWGAIGALVLALILALVQVLRWWFAQRRAQAELVSAWWESHPQYQWAFVVHNGSTAGIYSVSVDNRDGSGGPIHWLMIPPGRTMHLPTPGVDEGVLPPSPVPISFTDSGGRGWSRYKNGSLVRNWHHDSIEFYRVGRFAELRHKARRATITREKKAGK